MDNLADKVIEANEREVIAKGRDDSAPDGYYTDDLGMWVEQDIRKHSTRFADYVFVRCRKRNPHLYYDADTLTLYNRHQEITSTPRDILELANLADMITTAQAIWVFNKLKETVPRLDKNRIVVAPGLAWNMEKSELEKIEGEYYTVGGENEC